MRKFLPTVLWLALFGFATVPNVRAQGCSFENRGYFDESELVGRPEGPADPHAVEMPDQPEIPEVDVPSASE